MTGWKRIKKGDSLLATAFFINLFFITEFQLRRLVLPLVY